MLNFKILLSNTLSTIMIRPTFSYIDSLCPGTVGLEFRFSPTV